MTRIALAESRRSSRVRVTPADQRDKLLAWSRRNGSLSSVQARAILGSTPRVALTRLAELVASGDLEATGTAHHKSWFVAPKGTPARNPQDAVSLDVAALVCVSANHENSVREDLR